MSEPLDFHTAGQLSKESIHTYMLQIWIMTGHLQYIDTFLLKAVDCRFAV